MVVYMNVRMETDAAFTHQSIPQRAGCPCQTTSSWSDAPARPQDGPRRRQSGDGETTKQSGAAFSIHFSVEFCLYCPSLISETAKKNAYAGKKKIHRL